MKSKEYEKKDKIVNKERVNVKLPKVTITKFDGTSLDWFCFWNQFESEIYKAVIGPVSKFSYLKELLIPRVRLLINGLLFRSEVIQEPNLYYLVILVSQLKSLLPIFNVLPLCLLFKIHI